jgi:hypothetical protein
MTGWLSDGGVALELRNDGGWDGLGFRVELS